MRRYLVLAAQTLLIRVDRMKEPPQDRLLAWADARCMAIAQGAIQSSSCASGGAYSASSTNTYIENIASGWGLSVRDSNIHLDTTGADCGGTSGLSEVKITIAFTTPVPQIVLLSAGAEPSTATACYPNNPF